MYPYITEEPAAGWAEPEHGVPDCLFSVYQCNHTSLMRRRRGGQGLTLDPSLFAHCVPVYPYITEQPTGWAGQEHGTARRPLSPQLPTALSSLKPTETLSYPAGAL